MPTGSPQFSPRQLLEAGRRAEAEGKFDLAYQFYGHLSHHHGHTAEGTEGRLGLARIGKAGRHLWMNGEAQDAANENADRSQGGNLYRREYRLGRALAALLSGIGWLTVAAAVAVIAAGSAEELGYAIPHLEYRLGRAMTLQAAAGLPAGGLLLLLGQVLRAHFDQASALQELVAIERARAGISGSG